MKLIVNEVCVVIQCHIAKPHLGKYRPYYDDET